MKDKISTVIAYFILLSIILVFIFMIISIVKAYKNYEVQGESFTIVCDEIKMNVSDNNYICTNNEYTYNFNLSYVLDLSKNYDIEIYYQKTHWISWLGTSAVRERQMSKIVERIK